MTPWNNVPDEQSYGIIIYNFKPNEEHKLNVNVGEAVHILSQEENWFFGYAIYNQTKKGIFPKNYVQIIECTVDKEGITPVFILKQPTIAHEITTVLREWGMHWKRLYVNHDENFDKVKTQIYELISHRSKILSSTLTVDELRNATKSVTKEIDMGNKLLGLDLIIRDKNGNIINSKELSTVCLYQMHKNATERINKAEEERREVPVKTAIHQYSHIFLVCVRNFTVKTQEDADIFIFLYDAKEYKAITESYVVKWSKDGLMRDIDQMYNLRVMFTDLGKRDLEREKIYLVCNVIRKGAMDIKEIDHRRSSVSTMSYKRYDSDGMRRPFGVAAKDVTAFLSGTLDCDLEQEYPIPFVNCDKDNLEQTLRKITNKDILKHESKNQSLFVSLKLLHGGIKQARDENPHLVLGNVAIARKMGFPEVILPGDVRNDLYITLLSGEFPKGNKTSDKNVEVSVVVCDDKGTSIPGVISLGSGVQNLNEYHSVIYYHEDKPQWHETFKIAIQIEEFKTSHIKFLFKHRSSNEAKDKSEKPFAMAYVKLMQNDGTTLKDAKHNLVVYKLDYKKISENDLEYFKLPSTEEDLKNCNKIQITGYSLSTKDNFLISSNICSTKLTQNIKLLGLLNWPSHKENLENCLKNLLKVDGEEIVKFLQDILDALFNILMEYPDTNKYDKMVFECLLYIIGLVSNDYKYQHFEPVLDLYIKESFSATLAYSKLISVITELIDSAEVNNSAKELLFKTMKSLQYIIKFISRSRMLYIELYQDGDTDEFKEIFKEFLLSLVGLMSLPSDALLREHGFFLKSLPSTISDIMKIFDHQKLSDILCDLFNKIPPNRLTKQKMMTINEIVHSQLFLNIQCRRVMLPVFTNHIKQLLIQQEEGMSSTRAQGRIQNRSVEKVAKIFGESKQSINKHRGYPEEVELCIKVLSDILNLLFHQDYGAYEDITEIMKTTLRTVIQAHIKMDRDNPHSSYLVAVMIDIFRQMKDKHYEDYINEFNTRSDILDFLMEILLVFKDLVNQSVFPSDWCEMILVQNEVILKALKFFSNTIRDHCFENFDQQAWSNFFHCAIAFMTQPSLQLETFSENKNMRILKRFNDMRRITGFEIRALWFNLGTHKVHFVPGLVGPFLEMTLIPEKKLRTATIPIFFDMMQAEYYSSKYEFESFGDTKRDSSHIKGNFCNFENEIVSKLDTLIEGGKGDENYKVLFYEIMIELCSRHTSLKLDGVQFVKMVTKLIARLLEYRNIIHDENKENRMSCTVNLLEFYSEINRQEMYIRYVYKLCDLHLECDDYTEAAYTLQLHTKLLEWSDNILSPMLKSRKLYQCQTHRDLKESLYNEIIDYFSKGKMYECALEKCQELVKQYEEETFDYDQLSKLHNTMAKFYDEIMKNLRPECEYFRVGYFGRGFPTFIQNKVFIYRGKGYEKLADFTARIVNAFPKAELIHNLNEPGEAIRFSDKQYIQVNKVDPVMDEKTQRFSGKPVSQQIVKYYKSNHIKKFQFSRPFIRKDPKIDFDNEFANLWIERTFVEIKQSLPGILRWFPIEKNEVIELSPLRTAIETMEISNKELRNLVLEHKRDKSTQLNPLTMKINGIIDPAVMGGIMNYEKVFFSDEYIHNYPDDCILIQRLKDLIADQMPLLELCVHIHRDRVTPDLMPLHKRIEECFTKMQENVFEKYGKRTCDLKLDNVTMRRHYSIVEESKPSESDVVGIGNRVSSLTRAQVTSFKHFTSTFHFSTSSPQINSKSHNTSTRSLLSPNKSSTNTPSLSTKKSKNSKEKRRSSKTEIISSLNVNSGTKWYNNVTDDVSNVPVFELTQELTPTRPLRSEVEKEKRLSRSSSGQFSRPNSLSITIRGTNSSGNSSNRDSIGTTDSSISEEDLIPPPLPLKLRESESNNTPANSLENQSFLHSKRCSVKSTVYIKLQSPEASEYNENASPPTPPPKPPKKKT